MKYGLFLPAIHFTPCAMSSSPPGDPDVSLTHSQRCVCVCVDTHACAYCIRETHGLIFYSDASLSAAGTGLPDIPCVPLSAQCVSVCVHVINPLSHTFTLPRHCQSPVICYVFIVKQVLVLMSNLRFL